MMRTCHLIGAYGDRMIDLDANHPVTLIRGLESQVPGFGKALRDYPEAHIILTNDDKSEVEALTPDLMNFTLGKLNHVYIVPATAGGAGFGVVAAWIGSYLGVSTAAAYVITAVIYIAAYVAIAQILAPSPLTGGTKADENKSNLFDGVANITRPGSPIPIVYGEHTIGSVVLASDLNTIEVPYEPPEPGGWYPDAPNWNYK